MYISVDHPAVQAVMRSTVRDTLRICSTMSEEQIAGVISNALTMAAPHLTTDPKTR